MTNESPGYVPQWITGEVLPVDAQHALRSPEAKRVLDKAAIDFDRFAAEMVRVRAEFNAHASQGDA